MTLFSAILTMVVFGIAAFCIGYFLNIVAKAMDKTIEERYRRRTDETMKRRLMAINNVAAGAIITAVAVSTLIVEGYLLGRIIN